MREFTYQNFEKEVINSDKPVVIDFWAPWCGPCKMLEPHIEGLADEHKDRINFGKINIDEHPELANQLSVMNIPTVIFFKSGEEVGRVVGMSNKDNLNRRIQEALF